MHLSGRQRHPSAWIALVLETTRAHVTAVTLSRRLKQLLESAAVGTYFFSIAQGRVQVIDSIATRRHHTRQRLYLSLQEWIGGPELATRYGQVCILLVCGVSECVCVCVTMQCATALGGSLSRSSVVGAAVAKLRLRFDSMGFKLTHAWRRPVGLGCPRRGMN